MLNVIIICYNGRWTCYSGKFTNCSGIFICFSAKFDSYSDRLINHLFSLRVVEITDLALGTDHKLVAGD